MQSPNYFSGIVKILENPRHKTVRNNIITTQCRALIPPSRKNKLPKVVLLIFWGTLARDITNYYQMNDYILIEGYLSIKTSKKNHFQFSNSKKVLVTILKFYPILLKLKKYE